MPVIVRNSKLSNIDSKLLTRIYKALVESKMLYGVEIWGDSESWNNLDKIRDRFCKIILGIPGSASNDAARCGLGFESSIGLVLTRIINY